MKLMLWLLFCILSYGCSAATHPNPSVIAYIITIPAGLEKKSQKEKPLREISFDLISNFERLYTLDPLLAEEVGRLPEFQGDNINTHSVALSRLVSLVENASKEERENLKSLLQVGHPTVRKYCSPLQAIFWLCETDAYGEGKSPLGMSLYDLLEEAWLFHSQKDKWNDFKSVTDRLNSPELVNYYQRKRFYYASTNRGKDLSGYPIRLFRTGEGDCIDYTAFAIHCLTKGGYKAWEYHVASPSGLHTFHAVVYFDWDGKEYIMDNGRPDNRIRQGIVPAADYEVGKT